MNGFGIATSKEFVHDKNLSKVNDLVGDSCIGHNLHSVVGDVFQPFVNADNRFAINGEIYNWKELDKKYKFGARNDSEVAFNLIRKKGIEAANEFDGVFAICYWKSDKVYLVRDIIGVKPIWYSLDEKLAFCSEKKVLLKEGLQNIVELNPRVILEYDVNSGESKVIKRKFFDIKPEHSGSKEEIIEKVADLSLDAIKKRIPDGKFGILFSGGIDSTYIAYQCKKLGLDFTCYTAALKNEKEAPDLVYAKKVAKELGLDLKFKLIDIDEVSSYLKKVVPLIEDSNVVKVGVGLTFYVACELAKKDNIKVIFSGLGSEELFAGYQRHKESINVNEECLSGVRKIYERDMYRDDVITMNNNLELRLPFLDKKLTEYSLRIPAKYKLDDTSSKLVLREAAIKSGLSEEFSFRPKKAAQYGSYFDKAIGKLAKRDGKKLKSEYLKQFYKMENLKLGALLSGGKDGLYAMHVMQKQNYDISCFISIVSKNQDSYMFHTPNIGLVDLQAESCGIPLVLQETQGEKEAELEDLEKALSVAVEKYGIQGVCSGAIFSNYQRERIEKICDKLGLKIFSPLWHMNQELEMRNLLDEGFEIIFSSIAAEGLDKSFLGRVITEKDVDKLVSISKKVGMNVAGEGGEFESLVLDCPVFRKKIEIVDSEIVMENEITGRFVVKKSKLQA